MTEDSDEHLRAGGGRDGARHDPGQDRASASAPNVEQPAQEDPARHMVMQDEVETKTTKVVVAVVVAIIAVIVAGIFIWGLHEWASTGDTRDSNSSGAGPSLGGVLVTPTHPGAIVESPNGQGHRFDVSVYT